MNVSAASTANDLWKLLQSSHTAASNGFPSTTGSSSATSASHDGSSLSPSAELFSTLQALSQSNPAEFKKISSEIASQLQHAATDAKNPAQADALNQLATSFQNAAKSGNFSDLFSQSGSSVASTTHAGGHHHHYRPGADNDDSSSTYPSSSTGQATSNPLNAIFSNALTQISKDLQSPTPSTAIAL